MIRSSSQAAREWLGGVMTAAPSSARLVVRMYRYTTVPSEVTGWGHATQHPPSINLQSRLASSSGKNRLLNQQPIFHSPLSSRKTPPAQQSSSSSTSHLSLPLPRYPSIPTRSRNSMNPTRLGERQQQTFSRPIPRACANIGEAIAASSWPSCRWRLRPILRLVGIS